MSTPNAPPAGIPPNIEAITAPLVLGELSAMYLSGVLSVQVYMYYLNFPKDATYIKAFVYIIFSMELTSTVLCILDTYHWFVTGFGNVAALNDIHFSAVDTPLLGALVATGVQMFYCYRIFTINKKAWWISVIVALLSLAQTAGGIFGAVVAEKDKTFSAAKDKAVIGAYILFVTTAVADIVIAATMVALLLRSSQKIQSASHERSNSVIRKILILITETNMASAFLAILTVILLFGIPNTNYFTCPSLILGRTYSNSLLLILNNRYYLATSIQTGEPSSGIFKTSKMRSDTAVELSSNSGGAVRVGVDTATDTYQSSVTGYKKGIP